MNNVNDGFQRTFTSGYTLTSPVRIYFAPDGTPLDTEDAWQSFNVWPNTDSARISTKNMQRNVLSREEVRGEPDTSKWPQRWVGTDMEATLTLRIQDVTPEFAEAYGRRTHRFDVRRYALLLVDVEGVKWYVPHAVMGMGRLALDVTHSEIDWYLSVTSSDEQLWTVITPTEEGK